MTRPVPTNIILEMNKRGYKDVDIIRYLKQKGYTPTEMSDAFNQAKVKLELERNQAAQENQEADEPKIEHFPKIPMIQKPASQDSNLQIIQIKMRSLEERQKKQLAYLENLRDQVIKKIQEDSSRMKEISAQVSALQQSFSKILQPLASNIKIKAGMLDLDKSSSLDEDEDKVVVIKETKTETKTVKPKSRSKTKSSTSKKKKEKSSLDDQFGK